MEEKATIMNQLNQELIAMSRKLGDIAIVFDSGSLSQGQLASLINERDTLFNMGNRISAALISWANSTNRTE